MSVLGGVLGTILLLLAGLHLYWAARGVVGGSAVPSRADGTPLLRPTRLACVAVAAALTVAGLLVLGQAAVLPRLVPASLCRIGVWGVAVVFALRAIGDFRYVGLFKRERATRFAELDTMIFTPLCLALAVAGFTLASGT